MLYKQILTQLKRYYQRLNGSSVEYDLKFYKDILGDIKKLSSSFDKKSDQQIKSISHELINKAINNENLDNLLTDAFALVREAVKRVLKLQPFDVQIVGGIAMHFVKLAEMQTGEGKTLTAVFPAYLNALPGKGIHVLTFND